tara:strand:- start:30 stop:5750 length:5721 start_codon:yes stop_codon:yes gene_type:complete
MGETRQLSPMEVHRRLQSGLAEAVVSRASIRHEGLNDFLREALAGTGQGALLSEQLFQAAPGYISSGKSPADLTHLLHPRTIEAVTRTANRQLRFDYPAYAHQLETWELLRELTPQSVLVSSGTGSGKTECFLVPMLDDLIREATDVGPLTGVRALMLYPLNALIASQEKRLTAWTKPLKGDVRFALYNGMMGNTRKSSRDKAEHEVPHQVLYRQTLRDNPPPVLVTNQTMLEYMTIRREDRNILGESQGKLRWIVIDEAHSYVGSAAAELSLLLRRVMNAFAVDPANVRFVATSATIGSADDEKAIAELQRFLADIAGVPLDRAHVVVGRPKRVDLELALAAANDPATPTIVENLESTPQTLTALKSFSADAEKILRDVAAHGAGAANPVMPMRAHSFVRAIPGLWSCVSKKCPGPDHPTGWPFGALLFDYRHDCPHCQSMVFEVQSCGDCGEPFLAAEDEGERIIPRRSDRNADEFREDSYRDRDHDDAEETNQPVAPRNGNPRLIAINDHVGSKLADFDLKTGELSDGNGAFVITQLDDGRCPCCRSSKRRGRPALLPFRFGAPFLTQNAAPIILEGVSAKNGATHALPFDGRQLISFSDSRQGTARFAANMETNGERGFVRGFIYHAVQKAAQGTELTPEKREDLEKKRDKLSQFVVEMPSFKDDIADIEAQLAGGRAAGISWQEMTKALAGEPAIGMMAKVWDAERSERYHGDRQALARFMLLREMARRPRNANAMETLGLARLKFPEIERLGQESLPEIVAERGFAAADWRDFLYFMVDYLRSYFAVDVDDGDARWMPGRASPRNVIGPDQPPGSKRDLNWPSINAKGIQPSAVLLLASVLGLDLADQRGRHDVNQLLRTAWDQLSPLLSGVGGTFRLHLEKRAEIEAVTTAWQCPLTRRILPRLVFGRSPNFTGKSSHLKHGKPDAIILPVLPVQRPLSPDLKVRVEGWLKTDSTIIGLRSRGIWSNIHDRAALATPYLRAEEHSAQQPPHRLRDFEDQFKEGEINLLACSTTMEMGVDIGSIEAVLMTNVPRSIANYNQRAGRAGRRNQGFSTSLTIARNTPLDLETFADPAGYLRRKLASPRVSLDSDRIAQRHANAYLLAEWFREVDGEFAKTKSGDFFGCYADLRSFDGIPPVNVFSEWLVLPATALKTEAGLSRLLKRTGLQFDKGVGERTAGMFLQEADKFRRTWERLRTDAEQLKGPARKSIEFQARRLCMEFLLKELANRSLIPGSGFPTSVVPFDTFCAETQRAQDRSRPDEDDVRSRRYECPTRNADIAIREYAPGAEVVVDGLVWTSAGISLNWLSPIDSGQREPQNLRWAWWCTQCGGAGSDHQRRDRCDHCGEADVQVERFIEPAGFKVDWSAKPHADTDQAAYIEPKRPKVSAADAIWQPLLQPESGRVRSTHEGYIYHHSRGPTDRGYEICLECGRAGEAGRGELEDHRPLNPTKGKAGERCGGNDAGYAITDALALGHEIQTDVVEVQLPSLESGEAAWALGSALREALTRWLGIEPSELGISVAARNGKLGRRVPSIYLFDESSGGAGYSPRLLDDLYRIFVDANKILVCPKDCEMGCSACVLSPDLYKQQGHLDRRGALLAVETFLKANAALPSEDLAVPDARAVNDAANAILLRAKSGDALSIYLAGPFDLAELSAPKMRSLFSSASTRGIPVTLVLAPEMFKGFGEVERRSLRDTAVRSDLKLVTGLGKESAHGSRQIAELTSKNHSTGFFSRDPDAAVPGNRWGIGESYAVVAGTTDSLSVIEPIPLDELERQVGPGDKVALMKGFGQCPSSQFGKRFVSKLKEQLEAADLWRPGELVAIDYTDRYLNSPLPMVLFLRTCEALASQLKAGDDIPVSVTVQPLKQDRSPYLIFHDWEEEDDRLDTAVCLGDKMGFDVLP